MSRGLVILVLLGFVAACSSYEGSPTTIECDDTSECPDDLVCIEGFCTSEVDPEECAPEEEICDGQCVDTSASALHCGACSAACDPGTLCDQGTCVTSCSGGTVACGGGCVDLDTNPNHCGDCDEACPAGVACLGGQCQIDTSCEDGLTDCGGTCVDISSDVAHCGGCGDACTTNDPNAIPRCELGECIVECADGFQLCDGACVDIDNDADHCGTCDNECTLSDCSGGQCEALNCTADDHAGDFGGGSGTDTDPYTICSVDHLQELTGTFLEAGNHFVLAADLDVGDALDPIGTDPNPFQGHFDGYGFTLSNLSMDSGNETALFAYVGENGVLHRLRLTDADVHGSDRTAILVSQNFGTITHSHVHGTVSGNNDTGGLVARNRGSGEIHHSSGDVHLNAFNNRAGGLVARNEGEIHHSWTSGVMESTNEDLGGLVGLNAEEATISSSSSTASVIGHSNSVGGLAGSNASQALIEFSHARGNITSTNENTGGLVGENEGFIRDSWATGNVSASGKRVGGLVGFSHGGSGCEIERSYATGSVSAGEEKVGGLVGRLSECIVTDAFATGNVNAPSHNRVGGLVGGAQGSAVVHRSYSLGDVVGNERVGGLVGYVSGSSSVDECYSTGTVAGFSSDVGPLAGRTDDNVDNSYWNSDTSGWPGPADAGAPLSADEFSDQSSFSGWDFAGTWVMDADEGRPRLIWED